MAFSSVNTDSLTRLASPGVRFDITISHSRPGEKAAGAGLHPKIEGRLIAVVYYETSRLDSFPRVASPFSSFSSILGPRTTFTCRGRS